MKEYKTVKEVIKRGHLMVNYPVAVIIVGSILISVFLIPEIISDKYIGIGIVSGVILGFAMSWLWWSYKIVKWRIWALENTKESDWPELEERAVVEKLIWPQGTIFEKTEIRSQEQNLQISTFYSRVVNLKENKTLDNIVDDPNIPDQLDFYFKKFEIIASILLPIICFIMGSISLNSTNKIIGLITIGIGVYLIDIDKIKNIQRRQKQMSITKDGIEVNYKGIGWVGWNETERIRVDTENGILSLEVWRDDELKLIKIPLNEFDVDDYYSFIDIINVYLKRNKMSLN